MSKWHGVGQVDDHGHTVGASAPASPGERRRAVRQVASLSRDAGDCTQLLTILGLDPGEGKETAA